MSGALVVCMRAYQQSLPTMIAPLAQCPYLYPLLRLRHPCNAHSSAPVPLCYAMLILHFSRSSIQFEDE